LRQPHQLLRPQLPRQTKQHLPKPRKLKKPRRPKKPRPPSQPPEPSGAMKKARFRAGFFSSEANAKLMPQRQEIDA
jgi:hypothetical protein